MTDSVFSGALLISLCIHGTLILGWQNVYARLLSNQPILLLPPQVIYEVQKDDASDLAPNKSLDIFKSIPFPASVPAESPTVFLPESVESKGLLHAKSGAEKIDSDTILANDRMKNFKKIPQRSKKTARVEDIDLSDILVFKVFNSYYYHLSLTIKGYTHYPPEMVNEHKEGMVYVSFVLHRNGSIANLKVVESSGDKRFDKTALDAIRKSAPFPKFPAAISENKITLYLPVSFEVD